MSRLTDLIAEAKAKDPQMGADLEREFRVLSSRLPFGLNFERHRPEAVELPQRPVRKGDKVRVLPKRGSAAKGDTRLWWVTRICNHGNAKVAELELMAADERETRTAALDDLVVVAEFRDTIYPGLIATGKVERGGDKPYHTVINGENYHVLKALTFTHRGKVDAIYIDPPYNTGAKDWKYNNDYVTDEDWYGARCAQGTRRRESLRRDRRCVGDGAEGNLRRSLERIDAQLFRPDHLQDTRCPDADPRRHAPQPNANPDDGNSHRVSGWELPRFQPRTPAPVIRIRRDLCAARASVDDTRAIHPSEPSPTSGGYRAR